MPSTLLVLAATSLELEPLARLLEGGEPVVLPAPAPSTLVATRGRLDGRDVVLAAGGVGKVNAALALGALAPALRPAAVLQVGIGGAFVGSFLPVGSVAVASEEVALDAGLRGPDGVRGMEALGFPAVPGDPPAWSVFPTDPAWSSVLARAVDAPRARFGTADAVTGDPDLADALHAASGADVESMEGAAAAQACLALGLPFAELRGVSNVVGVRDPAAWDVPAAVRRACEALRAGVALAAREGLLG